MDGAGPTIHPPAVVADGPLFSGVVINGRKLAAQQREAASIAAVAAAAKAGASRTTVQGNRTGGRADGQQAHAVATVATGGPDGIGDAEAMPVQNIAGGSGGSVATPALAAAASAVTARANGCRRVAAPRSRLADRLVFNPADPVVKEEILSIIVQYLSDEGYASASASVARQARFQAATAAATRADMWRMRGAILDGDWATVESLCGTDMFKPLKPFHYAVGRQQYLELIDGHEYQKAFALLTKRLKPLESYRFRTDEFRDLCYLLTCKSVTDACSFRDWNGVAAYRERLVEQFAHLLSADQTEEKVVVGVAPGPDPLPHASSHGEGAGTVGTVATAPAVMLNGRDTEPSSSAAIVSSAVDPATGLRSRPRLSLAERVPPHHLVHLVTQALEHQVSSSRYQPTVPPRIGSILSEYECFVVPNVQRHAMAGHTGNVKCTVFVGDDGLELASGSSDNTVALWETDSGSRVGVLTGHTSRVWDVAASRTGALLASASGDGTVRLWTRGGGGEGVKGGVGGGSGSRDSDGGLLHGHAEIVGDAPLGDPSRGSMFAFKAALTGHRGDVYSVELHPNGRHLVTAGYDKTVRLYDVETHQEVRTFRGHNSSVATISFKPSSNVVFTGSKDSTIKCWDMTSGRCTKTFSSHLGEVTSVDVNGAGTMMLSSSKDNSNRLWDLRLGRPLRRFKGHQNTSKNFIRSAFGPNESLVIGGSEDGLLYIWDVDTSCVVQTLGPCAGAVYAARWNPYQSLLASCGHDGIVRTWWYDGDTSGLGDAIANVDRPIL